MQFLGQTLHPDLEHLMACGIFEMGKEEMHQTIAHVLGRVGPYGHLRLLQGRGEDIEQIDAEDQ